eukprot:scaffold95530_cov20-Prasinocladus_malaysianus.AAC.3
MRATDEATLRQRSALNIAPMMNERSSQMLNQSTGRTDKEAKQQSHLTMQAVTKATIAPLATHNRMVKRPQLSWLL